MLFQRSLEVPYCFYPQNFGGYRYINVTEAQWGLTAYMQREFYSPYPEDVPVLRMDIKMESKQRLHIKVTFIFEGHELFYSNILKIRSSTHSIHVSNHPIQRYQKSRTKLQKEITM
jgi:hypothetical protein